MLEIELCGVKMKNPTMLAAGVMGSTASSLNWVSRCGAGAVVTKSFSKMPNKGYKNPTTVEVTGGIINAIGLSSPGVETFKKELELINTEFPKVASIYGASPDEFSQVAAEVENLVDLIELNISCPHAMGGCGAAIGQDAELTYNVVKKVKKMISKPFFVKLTPNVTDLSEIVLSAKKGGCDGFTLINSLGPGMKIDLETAHPILYNKFGGMSGPAIKPIALRCVFETYSMVNIPIIGVGGISNYKDAVEFLYAGASAVQIGTAIMQKGPEIFAEICLGIEKFMKDHKFNSVEEMVGLAHKF
jgi:dihydroorotate dehydrogenase (NAD+) catalytic subunit